MANDYLMGKWQAWFKALDVNKDGCLSHTDTDISKDTFSTLYHLDEQAAETMGDKIEAWWQDNLLHGMKEDISLQTFVDNLNKELGVGKDKFAAKMNASFVKGLQIMDVNGDGFISEDEFIVMWKAFGHKDESMMRNLFKSLKPKDGLIAVQAMADAWVDFVSNDDSSVPSPIKEALDAEKS